MGRDIETRHDCGMVTRHPSAPYVVCERCANEGCPSRHTPCHRPYYEQRIAHACDECHEDCPEWSA